MQFIGYAVTCITIEAFSRILAGELGSSGLAERLFITVEEMLAEWARSSNVTGRLPTLAQIASFADSVASDRAGAMTSAIVNLTCGSIVDQCEVSMQNHCHTRRK